MDTLQNFERRLALFRVKSWSSWGSFAMLSRIQNLAIASFGKICKFDFDFWSEDRRSNYLAVLRNAMKLDNWI